MSDEQEKNRISEISLKCEVIRFEIDEHGNNDMFVKIPIGFNARWDKVPLKKGDKLCFQGEIWKAY